MISVIEFYKARAIDVIGAAENLELKYAEGETIGDMSEKNSLFYTNIENTDGVEEVFSELKEYAKKGINPVYIIDRPLEEKNVSYGYEKAIVILIPKHKIMFINYGRNAEKFQKFRKYFLEDLGYLSKKYKYLELLGRPEQWEETFTTADEYESVKKKGLTLFLKENKLRTKEDERKGEFLISLLTGSINNIKRTGIEYPENLLDKIKKKIILFDGDQTRFIFDEPKKDKIIIQGLAGTGKTELLLHKIKELYLGKENIKIAFTCHNKILAKNLRERIPEFFDFMKVDEQIKWNEKLWVMSGWGSGNNPDFLYLTEN